MLPVREGAPSKFRVVTKETLGHCGQDCAISISEYGVLGKQLLSDQQSCTAVGATPYFPVKPIEGIFGADFVQLECDSPIKALQLTTSCRDDTRQHVMLNVSCCKILSYT